MRGGLRLDAHKQRSTAQALRPASAATHHVLPLDQHAGEPAVPIVRPGQQVRLGQALARPGAGTGAWLHAPVSGQVSAIEPRPAPHHLGAPSMSIVVENDGRDAGEEHPQPSYEQLSPLELCEHIGRGGIAGLGGAVFPTATKLIASQRTRPLHLLLNGAECEPYISCDDMLMREHARDVVLGAQILMHALQASGCTIALEDGSSQAEQALRAALSAAGDERLHLTLVPAIYPAGGERQLISVLYGTEVPFDGLPADIGFVCQNVGTAAATAQWLREGRPLTSRIVTVTGDGVHAPANLSARLGSPIASLIADCGGYTERVARLIMGGTMMGMALPHDELPVTKASNCIIAASPLDLQPRGDEMPCIRCGDCAEVCPAMLLPQQLHWYLRGELQGGRADTTPASGELAGSGESLVPAQVLETLDRHGLMDCIECGCCDYVCPSQIPLVERFREAKPLLARVHEQVAAAQAARSRYEERRARLQRLEAQQREKLAEKRRQLSNRSGAGASRR